MKIATVGIGHIGGLQGFKKILKGGGIAGGGAALYGALVLSGLIPTDMPDAIVAFAVAALSAGINFLKIWLLLIKMFEDSFKNSVIKIYLYFIEHFIK